MRARLKATAIAIAAVVSVAILGQGCGSENSLVDGECAAGYVLCDGRCVAGGCGGLDASGDTTLVDGNVADGRADGTTGDGATDGSSGDGATDGSSGDGATDGSTGDGATDGGADAADACPPPPHDKPDHCGACGVVCVAPNGRCGSDGAGGFTCQPPCVFPEIDCDGICVDGQNDPNNCGACGKVCPSNLCIGGLCQGETPGDIVVIGHDYSNGNAGTSQARVVTNAVLIPSTNPVRVLSYEQHAQAGSVTNVKDILAANPAGRAIAYTVSNDGNDLASPDLVAFYDVVLVYDQAGANAATLDALGVASAASLATFTKGGGVVVVLDGAAGSGAMPRFLTSAALLDVPSHVSLGNGAQVRIVAPGDVISTGVLSPYGAFTRSVMFQPNEANGGNVTYVARRFFAGALTDPVVVHKIVP